MVEDFFQRIQSRARKGKMLHLENLCDIRDYIAENEWQIEAEGGMMKFYAKCADSMDCAPATVRDDLGIIRNYPDDDLKRWFAAGLGKDHIEAANWLQNEEACKYDAAHLLDKAVELGGPTGKRMTVPELEAFALGEKLNRPTTYKYIQTLTGWAVSIPKKLGWDADLTAEFEADVKRFVERWFV